MLQNPEKNPSSQPHDTHGTINCLFFNKQGNDQGTNYIIMHLWNQVHKPAHARTKRALYSYRLKHRMENVTIRTRTYFQCYQAHRPHNSANQKNSKTKHLTIIIQSSSIKLQLNVVIIFSKSNLFIYFTIYIKQLSMQRSIGAHYASKRYIILK